MRRIQVGGVEVPYREEAYLLGTDSNGRDLLSRLIYGSRISLSIGFLAMGLAVGLGILFGALAGYVGGWVDTVIMRFVDILLAFPRLLLLMLIITVYEGAGVWTVVLVLGLTGWMGVARLVRAEFLRLKALDYAMAARALGFGGGRIMFRHLMPNAMAPVIVSATLRVGETILVEAALSFLALGVKPPTATWGNIVQDGQGYLATAGWVALFPGLCIVAAVVCFNLVGDALRDALDPRQRSLVRGVTRVRGRAPRWAGGRSRAQGDRGRRAPRAPAARETPCPCRAARVSFRPVPPRPAPTLLRRPAQVAARALLACAGLLLSGCGADPYPGLPDAGTLHVALNSEMKGFDPAQADEETSNICVYNVFDQLYEYHNLKRPFELVPALAEAMPEVSADELTYTIRLKRGVRYQDDPCFTATGGQGREMVASDVVFCIQRLMDLHVDSPGSWVLEGRIVGLDAFHEASGAETAKGRHDRAAYPVEDGYPAVEGLAAPDPHTLVIRLVQPFRQLTWVLAMGYLSVYPPEAVALLRRALPRAPRLDRRRTACRSTTAAGAWCW